MSVPPIAQATLQAAVINAASNVLAQGIKASRNEIPFELDLVAVRQFTTCALVTSPLGYLWLDCLESCFPGRAPSSPRAEEGKQPGRKPPLNVVNTVAKVIIDQLIGGAWNTVLYSAVMGLLRSQQYDQILHHIQQDFWPIMIAGLKLWPLVSILNFTVVPAHQRLLVGSLFGMGWAVYLSLVLG